MKTFISSLFIPYYSLSEWICHIHLRLWRIGRFAFLKRNGLKCEKNPFPEEITVRGCKYMLIGGVLE